MVVKKKNSDGWVGVPHTHVLKVCVLASFASRWGMVETDATKNDGTSAISFDLFFSLLSVCVCGAKKCRAAFCNFFFPPEKKKQYPIFVCLCVCVCVAGTYVIIQLSCLYTASFENFLFEIDIVEQNDLLNTSTKQPVNVLLRSVS